MQKIKSSKHTIINLNSGKKEKIKSFISKYREAVDFYINYLWDNKIIFKSSTSEKIFDIKNDKLDCPLFISTKNLEFKTNLSARALSSAATQACGLVNKAIEKRKRYLFVLNKTYSDGKRTRCITNKLKNIKLIKPNSENINVEISSKNVKIEKSHIKHFDIIITLSSIGKNFGKIVIPIKHNKHSKKLESKSTLLGSILLSNDIINLRWEYDVSNKIAGNIVGADSGINSVLTFSDGQQSKADIHNHTLNSILQKISRKEKGSKAFHKALDHKDNFIGWSINQLNLNNIKEIRLEKVSNFRNGKNVGKFLNYSSESLIRSKLIDYAEDRGVRVILQSSAYRSQRCSQCGYVYSGNRKGKMFSCKHCSFQADADYNASCNHEQNLPSSNCLLYYLDKPKKFFWKAKGFFNLDGSEFRVPNTIKVKKL